jgi:hypothetical protein
MKVSVYYHHLLALGKDPNRIRTVDEFTENAWRFSVTYRQFKPLAEHELVVVFMRKEPTEGDLAIWSGIPCRFETWLPLEPDGWYPSCYRVMSERANCDFMVNFVSRAYFHREGWLKRLVDTRKQFGDGFYGTMASFCGCPTQTHPYPNPHLRGTAWAFDPVTMRKYPHVMRTPADEYKMECGEWNISTWYESIGKPAMLVTFDGAWSKPDWGTPKNTFCNGDQSNLLNWDRHSDAYQLGIPVSP